MKAVRQRDTKAEARLQAALRAIGLEFATGERLPSGSVRRADIVFKAERVAAYVDGCFWHGCPAHGTWPKSNADFWRQKIEANIRRDTDSNALLAAAGWEVVRVWEHEDPDEAAARIGAVVESRRVAGS